MSFTPIRLGSLPQAHRSHDRSQPRITNEPNNADEPNLCEHGTWEASNETVAPERSIQQGLLPTTRKRQIIVLISAFCTVFQTIGRLVNVATEARVHFRGRYQPSIWRLPKLLRLHRRQPGLHSPSLASLQQSSGSICRHSSCGPDLGRQHLRQPAHGADQRHAADYAGWSAADESRIRASRLWYTCKSPAPLRVRGR